MKITNKGNIPLGLAVWLMHDEYDYINTPNYISATQLMKPIRQIILPSRVPKEQREFDLEDRISAALGHSLHDSIEKAWLKGYRTNLKKLGYPEKVLDRVLINPTEKELEAVKDPIPVYLEQRAFKPIVVNGTTYTVGGKFDMATEGIVNDNKSTTAYTWVYGGRDEDYKLQGSLYRWLNTEGFYDPECADPIGVQRITEDFIRINFIFTDWQRASAKQNPNYPQSRLQSKDIPLMLAQETEAWVRNKIALVHKYKDKPEHEIPECTDEELWKSDPVFKYYSDPKKTDGRSTKNFDNLVEAKKHHMSKGGKGIVITVPGEVKRCTYCDAYPVCSQRKRYFHD